MNLINSKIPLIVCVVLSLCSCSPNKTADEHLASAKAHIENNKHAEALIETKSAVRLDGKNAEARLLLGSLYLSAGESAAAEKELSRALTFSDDVNNILPKLLKALNLQHKNEEMIVLIAKHDEVSPEILLYQALAYKQLGEKEKAKQSIVHANELSTESIYSQLGDAYLKADSSDIDGALDNINKILVVEPSLTEALMLKGQLYYAKKDYAKALNAFNEYHKQLPNAVQIRLFLANTYVKNEQFDEANKHLDFLMKLVPEHAFTNQLKGIVFYQDNNYKQALAHAEKAIQNGLDTPSNRVVAGLSAFKLAQYELAHQYLLTLSEILSPTHPVSRVLALVQMQLGYSAKAVDTLDNLKELTSQDVSLFTAASFELLKIGKIAETKKLVAKTDSIGIDSSQEMARLGILKLSMNDLEGLADLEKAIEIDPDLPMARIALAAAYIENKEYSKALDLAEKWKMSNPRRVEGYNLKAKILLIQSHVAEAELELRQALTVNESNTYSLLYFANKYLLNEQAKEAIEQLKKIFLSSPDNLTALKLNYQAHKSLATEESAISKVMSSFDKNKNNLAYRLLYARVSFIEQDFRKTIELLEHLDKNKSVPAMQWALLGDSYFKLNNNDEALAVYNEWIKAQPLYRAAWLRKIATQEKLADYSGALSTVEQVLAKAPDDSQFHVLRANYLILTKDYNEAQVQIDSLSAEQKELPLVKGLQGKIWLTEGEFEKSISGLQGLYGLLPNPYNTALLFTTHIKLGQENTAFDFIQKHVASYPEDSVSRNVLAERAITYNPSLAKQHYLVLLKSSPRSLSILNNLAWVEYKLANYVEANKLVDSALKLNALNPQILDTAGLVQLKLGNREKAIELLKKAKLLAPKDGEIAKHYQEAVTQ